jgi:hypothetical protein
MIHATIPITLSKRPTSATYTSGFCTDMDRSLLGGVSELAFPCFRGCRWGLVKAHGGVPSLGSAPGQQVDRH